MLQVKGQSDVQDSTLLSALWRSQIGLTGFVTDNDNHHHHLDHHEHHHDHHEHHLHQDYQEHKLPYLWVTCHELQSEHVSLDLSLQCFSGEANFLKVTPKTVRVCAPM